MNILSRDEAIALGLKRYFTGLTCKSGHQDERSVSNHTCVSCLKVATKKYIEAHPELMKATRKASGASYYAANKASINAKNKARSHLYAEAKNKQARAKRKEDPESDRQYRRDYAEKNRELTRAWARKYADKYRKERYADVLAANAIRRARRIQATPAALGKAERAEMAGVYLFAQVMEKMTGMKYHVDHIVPLQGESVSGLHVPSNLRVIPAIENILKSNKFIEELA